MSEAVGPTRADHELIAHQILGRSEGVLCSNDEVWKWMHTKIPSTVFGMIIKRITVALAAEQRRSLVSLRQKLYTMCKNRGGAANGSLTWKEIEAAFDD